MSESSANSSQAPMSQGSQPESESHLESINESEAIEIDNEEDKIEKEPSEMEDLLRLGQRESSHL
jgi:hypothetical protein